jgi:hypothetical protein
VIPEWIGPGYRKLVNQFEASLVCLRKSLENQPSRLQYFKSGQVQHLWLDTQTFLEVKVEGVPRRMDGKMRPVEICYRDYKSVNGLMVPYVLETTAQGVKQSHKMSIESVVVNPKLDDSLFGKPISATN